MSPKLPRNFLKQLPVVALCAFVGCKQTEPNLKPTDTAQNRKDSVAVLDSNTTINPDTVGKRTLYLTFDDGPNNGTSNVVNILRQEQVPASFFLIGLHVKEMAASHKMMPILRSMPNVVLCNHSYTHGYKNHFEKFYADVPGVVNDFKRSQDSVHFTNPIGRTPGNNIWRTPKFSQNTYARYKPASDNLQDSGFVLMGWDAEWRYHSLKLTQSVDQMEKDIENLFTYKENKAPNHCVILMHDLTFADSEDSTSLQQLIHRFKKNPLYRFDVVTNHPLVKP